MVAVEEATCGQTDSALWYALHYGTLTNSRFGEILHHKSTTNPRRLLRDITGYGGYAKGMPHRFSGEEIMSQPHVSIS